MRRILAVTAITAAALPWGAIPAHAGGSCHEPSTQGSTATIEITGVCFTPTINRVAPGSTVSWRNTSGIDHNLAGSAEEFGVHEFVGTQAVRITFPAAGTYPYACTFHPGMTGVVIVGDGGGKGVIPAAHVLPAAPETTSPPAVPVADTVTVAATDDSWADNTAAVGGAGAGVLGLGLAAGFGLARRRESLTD
jgi:plastocyanin